MRLVTMLVHQVHLPFPNAVDETVEHVEVPPLRGLHVLAQLHLGMRAVDVRARKRDALASSTAAAATTSTATDTSVLSLRSGGSHFLFVGQRQTMMIPVMVHAAVDEDKRAISQSRFQLLFHRRSFFSYCCCKEHDETRCSNMDGFKKTRLTSTCESLEGGR